MQEAWTLFAQLGWARTCTGVLAPLGSRKAWWLVTYPSSSLGCFPMRKIEKWQRRAWAEVDLDAIAHNTRVLTALAAPAELCAVVKADGYGHGAPEVARAALAAGATCLAVGFVEEGIALREAGISAPILALSVPTADAMGEFVAHDLVPSVCTHETVEALRHAAAAAGRQVGLEVNVDSGMHRAGANLEEAVALLSEIAGAPELRCEGMWTHFAVADDPEDPFTDVQLSYFEQVCAALDEAGIPRPRRLHAANSAGTIAHPRSRYDMVRCGISLYGYMPSPQVKPELLKAAGVEALRPALSWKAEVSHVRTLEAGEKTSYGRAYTLSARADIATVPVGYRDGLPRDLFPRGGEVLIGGRRRTIAGVVSMDQLLVDCGENSGVHEGDEVVLIGSQGDESVDANDWAEILGTIHYEILCGIGSRVARTYVGGRDEPAGA